MALHAAQQALWPSVQIATIALAVDAGIHPAPAAVGGVGSVTFSHHPRAGRVAPVAREDSQGLQRRVPCAGGVLRAGRARGVRPAEEIAARFALRDEEKAIGADGAAG